MADDEVPEPAVPARPLTPEQRDELRDYGVKLPEPKQTWVGTEDDRHGGLSAVLARELDRYGLPAHAGLTGLLRHLEGNHAMVVQTQNMTIDVLHDKFDRMAALVREATNTDENVPLDAAIKLLGEGKHDGD